jgi:hypothetical protein
MSVGVHVPSVPNPFPILALYRSMGVHVFAFFEPVVGCPRLVQGGFTGGKGMSPVADERKKRTPLTFPVR